MICPIDLRKHASLLKIMINTSAASPYSSSYLPSPLNQNQSSFTTVWQSSLLKLFAHKNVTLWTIWKRISAKFCFLTGTFVRLWVKFYFFIITWHPNFLEAKSAFHLVLNIIDYEFTHGQINVLVFFVFEGLKWIFEISNCTVFVVDDFKSAQLFGIISTFERSNYWIYFLWID